MTKTILIALTGILILSCEGEKNTNLSSDVNTKSALWEDKTQIYSSYL